LPLDRDTLTCNEKAYYFDKWMIKEQPNWTKEDDTLFGLEEKLRLVCDLINKRATANIGGSCTTDFIKMM